METKLEILHRCFEEGEEIKSISEEYGYSRGSIYSWRKKYLSGGAGALMNKKKDLPRGTLPVSEAAGNGSANAELAAKIKELELENDILKQTIEILKKRKGHRSVKSEKQREDNDNRCPAQKREYHCIGKDRAENHEG